jgi:hypothetical protein
LPILLFPLCQTIGAAILTLPIGEAQLITKIHENFSLVLRICHASPIGSVKAPRFVFQRIERNSANNISQK